MVEALAIGRVGGPAEGEVPLEEVGLEGLSRVVGRRRVGYLGRLSDLGTSQLTASAGDGWQR